MCCDNSFHALYNHSYACTGCVIYKERPMVDPKCAVCPFYLANHRDKLDIYIVSACPIGRHCYLENENSGLLLYCLQFLWIYQYENATQYFGHA